MISRKEFEKAYEELQEPLFRHCFFRVFNRETAKDIMQETFMKTWEYNIRGNEIYSLKSFLYKVAHNLIVNEISRRKIPESLEQLSEENNFEPKENDNEKMVLNAEINILRIHLEELDELDHRLVVLRYIDGLSLKEIASITELTLNNVSVRLHRSLLKMKKFYER